MLAPVVSDFSKSECFLAFHLTAAATVCVTTTTIPLGAAGVNSRSNCRQLGCTC